MSHAWVWSTVPSPQESRIDAPVPALLVERVGGALRVVQSRIEDSPDAGGWALSAALEGLLGRLGGAVSLAPSLVARRDYAEVAALIAGVARDAAEWTNGPESARQLATRVEALSIRLDAVTAR